MAKSRHHDDPKIAAMAKFLARAVYEGGEEVAKEFLAQLRYRFAEVVADAIWRVAASAQTKDGGEKRRCWICELKNDALELWSVAIEHQSYELAELAARVVAVIEAAENGDESAES